MTATNYLDLAGLQRFKSKLDDLFRTETQVDGQIDAKLATFSQNYVQIVSDVPTIAGGAQEGIIYLVPDSNAASGTFAYVAYAVESVSGTPQVVRVGAGTTVLPTVDQTVIDDSPNAVAGGAVFDELAGKVDKATVTTNAPASASTDICTSGAVYTALQDYITIASKASTVTDGDTNVVTGDAVHDFVTTEMANIQTISDAQIDALFV